MIEAVVFDMDGVLVDTEGLWDEVRRELVAEWGGVYPEGTARAMMGMSSTEWSAYMAEQLGVQRQPAEIGAEVVRRLRLRYTESLPVIDGAVGAVRAVHQAGLRLALASSSNRELIDEVLARTRLSGLFEVTVSSEEVAHGKPAPDVYLAAVAGLRLSPDVCVAVEDSSNGLRAAHAAGLRVIAVPNHEFPPADDALALAEVVVGSTADVTPALRPVLPHVGEPFQVTARDPLGPSGLSGCTSAWWAAEAAHSPTRGSLERTVPAGQVCSARSTTQPLCPPRPIAFERATSTCTSRASFGT